MFLPKMKLWSNMFFLVPFSLAMRWSVFWYAPIIGLAFLFSCLYHYSDEKHWGKIDILFALVLISSNFILMSLGHLKPIEYVLACIAFALLAGLFYFRQYKYGYNLNHSAYHISSAIICVLCLLIFSLNT